LVEKGVVEEVDGGRTGVRQCKGKFPLPRCKRFHVVRAAHGNSMEGGGGGSRRRMFIGGGPFLSGRVEIHNVSLSVDWDGTFREAARRNQKEELATVY